MNCSYLVRYGLMSQVGRFAADPGAEYRRGQAVVVRSWRGTELGEILIESNRGAAGDATTAHDGGPARVLRPATDDDLRRAGRAEGERDARYAACASVFHDGTWPIELVDVEPLLDDRRTVLHYLGPHRLDTAGLLAAFRARCDLDVMFQPVGRDAPDDEGEDETQAEPAGTGSDAGRGCGSCSSGSGGCGTSGGGCSDCGVKKLLAARR